MMRRSLMVTLVSSVLVLVFAALAAAEVQNLALTGTVAVDSTFHLYVGDVIADGELNDQDETGRWAEVAWASAETPGEHWAEITLAQESVVSGVSIWWARDRNKWWMSSNFVVQYWDGEQWVDIWEYRSERETYNVYSTEITFVPVTTTKIRVLQRDGGGPVARPNLMWIAEIQVWGEPVKK